MKSGGGSSTNNNGLIQFGISSGTVLTLESDGSVTTGSAVKDIELVTTAGAVSLQASTTVSILGAGTTIESSSTDAVTITTATLAVATGNVIISTGSGTAAGTVSLYGGEGGSGTGGSVVIRPGGGTTVGTVSIQSDSSIDLLKVGSNGGLHVGSGSSLGVRRFSMAPKAEQSLSSSPDNTIVISGTYSNADNYMLIPVSTTMDNLEIAFSYSGSFDGMIFTVLNTGSKTIYIAASQLYHTPASPYAIPAGRMVMLMAYSCDGTTCKAVLMDN
jgi:hypothetical protein